MLIGDARLFERGIEFCLKLLDAIEQHRRVVVRLHLRLQAIVVKLELEFVLKIENILEGYDGAAIEA